MKISLVAGARPNFMKIAPIIRAINAAKGNGADLHFRLVHTGQHYDDKLSKVFFSQLGLPEPDVNLGAGSGTQAEQTARIMVEFERDLVANPVDLVVVVGDVTSTLACTIVAKKLNIRVAHVEGGIRSFDMSMPEEINRLVTDSIADYFFTTSEVANDNLRKAGVGDDRIFFVGNTMIDTLNANLQNLQQPEVWDLHKLRPGSYFLLTLHRPSNVDDLAKFSRIITAIDEAVEGKVVFPVHPRTSRNFNRISQSLSNIVATEPLSYFEFIYLLKESRAVITDSGGVQEETTVLGIPCLTLRNNTERPETVSLGTNQLLGDNPEKLRTAIKEISSGQWKSGVIPPLWDGRAAERIVGAILSLHLQVARVQT